MNWLYITHILVTVMILSIAFWPCRYLRHGVYLPLLISASWLLFDGCPLTIVSQSDTVRKTFTRDLLEHLFDIKLTEIQVGHLLTFLYLLVTVIGFHRLNRYECQL